MEKQQYAELIAEMKETYKNFNPRQAALDEARGWLTQAARAAMEAGDLPQVELPDFIVEIPADPKNGDVACNLALAGARVFKKAPRQIAETILAHLPDLTNSPLDRVEIAGPGFLNVYLSTGLYSGTVYAATLNEEYGRTDWGKGQKVNVEFVSANPTGPMHLGNARGGALGDCLAAVLDWAGCDVTREFYVNDAGNQIQKFGKSLSVRYQQIFAGEEAAPLPEDCYQGEDIKVLARAFADQEGDKWMTADEEARKQALIDFALPKNIAGLERDLAKYRITYDVWFRESTLHDSGAVQAVVDKLLASGACYKAEDGAILYRSAQFSEKYGAANKRKDEDEAKDEVLVRANGIPTYFAADIAYHYNKLAVRGFDKAIDVWGADHHGHVARMKGAMDAVGLDGTKLDVVLMQLVKLVRDGQPVRIEVPIDSARFFFNMREAGSQVEFDLDLAVKEDSDNPVYYVQYAHARICSILKKLAAAGIEYEGIHAWAGYTWPEEAERDLIRAVGAFPAEIVTAAKNYDSARITRYVIDLAGSFHKFYNSCRILDAEPATRQARIALCLAVKQVIFNVLTMFKITVPEQM